MNHEEHIGFYRLPEILKILPIGRSTFWAKVKCGDYPQPVKLGPRTTAWDKKSIHELVDKLSRGENV